MKIIITIASILFLTSILSGQGLVKIGDKAPKYNFNKLVNSSKSDLDISDLKGKPTVLSFWGTWCSPCIPEMKNLVKLQKVFGDKIQIIGVSNDDAQKLNAFNQKWPSKIWFASDATNNLWNIFDIQTAGHAVLIDSNNKVVAITETNKIDSLALNNLITSTAFSPIENRGSKTLMENQDPFKLDSTTLYSFILQPKLKGITPMKKQPRIGPFAKRRITIINLRPEIILSEAFGISLSEKVIYPTKEDSLKSNQNSYCIDFIIPENESNNLNSFFQIELNNHLPVKGVIQKKVISCLVLRPIEGKQLNIQTTEKTDNEDSFSSLEYSGKGIIFNSFIQYLENELEYPVYDATGLTKHYNIEFHRDNIEPLKSTKDSLAKMGLELVKDQKEMDVLVITARK